MKEKTNPEQESSRGPNAEILVLGNSEEFRRNAQLLEESQAIARLGGWELDLITNHLYWTAETYRIHDTSPEEFNPTVDAGVGYFLPESKRQISEALELAITKGVGYDLYLETYTTKGRKIDVRTTCEVTLGDGKPTKLTGIFQDITESKKAEIKLQVSEAKFKNSFEASPIPFALNDSDGNITDLNAAFINTFGYNSSDIPTLNDWWPSAYPDIEYRHWVTLEWEKRLDNMLQSGSAFEPFEINIRCKDGSTKVVLGSAAFLEKSLEGLHQIILFDITERKQAEEKLDTAFKELNHVSKIQKSILNALPSSIALINNSGEIVEVNEEWRRFGNENNLNSLNQCIGDNYIVISNNATGEDEQLGKKMAKGIEQVLSNTLHSFKMEYPCDSPSEKRWFKAEVTPIVKGQSAGAVIMHMDITERKLAELRLKEAKEKAEESDRLKSAFLANMSHEIRTPMNSIMGFANLLQKKDVAPQKEKEYLEMIQKSGNRMLNIINDIISISKIESGEIKVTLSPTNINEQLEFITSFFEPEASVKGIQVEVTSALPSRKATVITDREKVYGTLANLVKNALKFTNAGTVELGCRERPEQAELEFFVKDMGIGIRPDHLDFIFERFRQVNESTTRNYEGAGLGLAISKAQIEKLGGKIWVESEEGKGSIFYFTIPCKRELQIKEAQLQPAEPSSPPNKNQSGRSQKIVIAEDDFLSAQYLKAILNIKGNEILHANNGTEVVEMVRKNPDIDVVLMDISMPELSGLEATRQIRQFNKTVVIIIQSGYTFEDDIKQAKDVGCTDFIAKPVDENDLLRLVEKYVGE